MKFVKFAGILFLGIGILAIIVYGYLGGFRSIEVSKGEFQSSEIVFSTHKGAYKNLSKSWDTFKAEWEKAGLKECDSLAVYFDPPGTPEDKLRSVLGCRIDALSSQGKTNLKSKLPSFRLPESKALVAKFPFKNVLSFFVGPAKVYPAMKKIMQAEKLHGSVAIETYGPASTNQDMRYYMATETKITDYQKLLNAF